MNMKNQICYVFIVEMKKMNNRKIVKKWQAYVYVYAWCIPILIFLGIYASIFFGIIGSIIIRWFEKHGQVK